MRLVPGSDGWPEAYEYQVGGRTIRFRQDTDTPAPVLHLKLFDPINDHYGLSPIEAAAAALDTHNAAGAWNKALLDNAARPSGALVYGGEANLSETQFARLKEELESTFQGARNAGRPLLLEGGLDWKPLSLSPKELDFIAAKAAAAREIAAAFGVPPMLLGIPGDATYANFQEANRAFWRSTVVPLATRTLASIVAWLAPVFGPQPRLEIDLDRIEALAPEREALWRRVTAADFLTVDEKRQAIGYGALAPGASSAK
jgi:HK97 family phage portal protein